MPVPSHSFEKKVPVFFVELLLQAALKVCLDVFGPSQGVLVELTDCLDLATAAIREKRVTEIFRIPRSGTLQK